MRHFDGKVQENELRLYEQKLFDEQVRSFNGRPVRLTLVKGNKRSSQQNRYWWGVVIPLIMQRLIELGNDEISGIKIDEELVHYFLCDKFLDRTKLSLVNKSTGEVFEEREIPGRSSELSTLDFAESLIEPTVRWAAESLDIVIPDPENNIQ
jgi:hypothetical protein